jgi:hypothetical protein
MALHPRDDDTCASASRFDSIAAAAMLLTPHRAALFDILLQGDYPIRHDDGWLLQPIWISELVERADVMVRLLLLLDRNAKVAHDNRLRQQQEHEAVRRLAATLRMTNGLANRRVDCHSDLLESVVHDLVELFGPAVGNVAIKLTIEELPLQAVRWRALILAAGYLIAQSLVWGFRGRRSGTLAVTLQARRCSGRLIVSDDGCDPIGDRISHGSAVLEDLTAILDSQAAYRRVEHGGTTAEVSIPRRGVEIVERGSAARQTR